MEKKIGEKYGITYNKHGKKVNTWVDISKDGKNNDVKNYELEVTR